MYFKSHLYHVACKFEYILTDNLCPHVSYAWVYAWKNWLLGNGRLINFVVPSWSLGGSTIDAVLDYREQRCTCGRSLPTPITYRFTWLAPAGLCRWCCNATSKWKTRATSCPLPWSVSMCPYMYAHLYAYACMWNWIVSCSHFVPENWHYAHVYSLYKTILTVVYTMSTLQPQQCVHTQKLCISLCMTWQILGDKLHAHACARIGTHGDIAWVLSLHCCPSPGTGHWYPSSWVSILGPSDPQPVYVTAKSSVLGVKCPGASSGF